MFLSDNFFIERVRCLFLFFRLIMVAEKKALFPSLV